MIKNMAVKMDYSLTFEQKKAFKNLQKAFKQCKKADIYLWVDYGILSAVNGKIIQVIAPDSSLGELLDYKQVETIFRCNINENADDPLFVRGK